MPAAVRTHGDLEAAFAGCSHIVEKTYHTKANQQAMMETLPCIYLYGCIWTFKCSGFHPGPFPCASYPGSCTGCIKNQGFALSRPRIGGGFGAKQTVVAEVYPAIVTMKTGKPAKIIYSRYESQIASSPRHEMEVKVKLDAMTMVFYRQWMCIHCPIQVLWRTWTDDSGSFRTQSLFLCTVHQRHSRFAYDVVYTNRMSAGAYRGYGATQGILL